MISHKKQPRPFADARANFEWPAWVTLHTELFVNMSKYDIFPYRRHGHVYSGTLNDGLWKPWINNYIYNFK